MCKTIFQQLYFVISLDNYKVQVFFDDGKIVEYDATNDLQGDIFKPLQDINIFNTLHYIHHN